MKMHVSPEGDPFSETKTQNEKLRNLEETNEYAVIAMSVAKVCIIANFLLCMLKLTGGIIAGSSAGQRRHPFRV